MSDVTLIALSPPLGAVDVAPTTDLAATFHAASGVDVTTLVVTVDGTVAYTGGAFVRPGFGGTVGVPAAAYLTLRVQPRRAFLYSVKPQVSVALGSTGFPAPVTTAFDFAVTAPPPALRDPRLRRTAVDAAFAGYPALEAYRQALSGALRGGRAAPLLVLLAHRVATSCLQALLYYAPLAAPALPEVARLTAPDLAATDAVGAATDRLGPLWEVVLKELLALDLDTAVLALLLQHGASPNAPTRVAARCAAVLLAAQKLATP